MLNCHGIITQASMYKACTNGNHLQAIYGKISLLGLNFEVPTFFIFFLGGWRGGGVSKHLFVCFVSRD